MVGRVDRSDGLICDEGSVLDSLVTDNDILAALGVLEAETVFTCADGTGIPVDFPLKHNTYMGQMTVD